MKNILVLTLIASGLAISAVSSPAFAGSDWQKKQEEAQAEKKYQDEVKGRQQKTKEEIDAKYKYKFGDRPSGSGSSRPSSGGGYESSSAPLSIVFGPSVILTNGLLQYGVQAKFLEGNFNMRTGAHFGGGSSIFNGGFTYSFGGSDAMFNPFIGGGLAYNPSRPVDIDGNPNFFSFYSTAGVDIKLSDSIVITGSVKLPSNSNFGTEYQASFNLFGGQY
jgi:hypothetical protein